MANSSVKGAPSLTAVHQMRQAAVDVLIDAGDEERSALNEKQRGLRDPVRTPDVPKQNADEPRAILSSRARFLQRKINAPSP